MKRFVPLFMAIIILLGGSGCMALELNSEWHQAEVLKYLEGKYGEEFQINKVRDASWAYNFKTALCSPVANPEIEFQVRRSKEKGLLNYYNSDGYTLQLMNQELYAYIEELTKGKWEDFKISTSVTTMNHVSAVPYTAGMTLKEFVEKDVRRDAFYNAGIYINVKDLDPNDEAAMDEYFRDEPEIAYKLLKNIIDQGHIANLLFVYLNEEEYREFDVEMKPSNHRDDLERDDFSVYWTAIGRSSKAELTSYDETQKLYDWRRFNG